MRESEVEGYLVGRVKALGGIAYKFVSPGRRNVPDRLVVLPGIAPFFIEVKRPGLQARAGQEREIARLRALGQGAEVVDTLAGVDQLLAAVVGGVPRCA